MEIWIAQIMMLPGNFQHEKASKYIYIYIYICVCVYLYINYKYIYNYIYRDYKGVSENMGLTTQLMADGSSKQSTNDSIAPESTTACEKNTKKNESVSTDITTLTCRNFL